ncbi:IST1 [Candida jiufengensis]|uniref:IST1 n=1 Tax=Candida jiufengensis TaxID=497108 RepID=UPI002224A567|nr:IST1 [Candida jiufengensis]KAI5953165.1 IST1 [Candida jiufengensis]
MPKPIPPHLQQSRLKINLKMALSKINFTKDKKIALTKQQRRQLAELLNQRKESSAKIKVENIIRDDIYIELLEILELYCELLLTRINLILERSTLDKNLIESISSIIYSANFTELKELQTIKDIFILKYGSEFGKECLENSEQTVPDKIVRKCIIDAPSEELVNMYLVEIALAYSVPYSGLKNLKLDDDDEKDDNDNDNNENGGTKEAIKEDPLTELNDKPSVAASKKPVDPVKPKDDFEDIAKRFAALKNTPK